METPTVQDPRLTPSFGAPPSDACGPATGGGEEPFEDPSTRNVVKLRDKVYMPAADLAWAPVLCESCHEREAAVRIEGRDYCAKCCNEGKPGAVRCGVCGKEIHPGEETGRLNFGLCHASCIERLAEGLYEEFSSGIYPR